MNTIRITLTLPAGVVVRQRLRGVEVHNGPPISRRERAAISIGIENPTAVTQEATADSGTIMREQAAPTT